MKLILFDLDGTLVKAGHCGANALDYAIAHMTNAQHISARLDLSGNTDSINFAQAYALASGAKPSEEKLQEIIALYLARLPKEIEHAVKNGLYHTINGIAAFLKDLAARKDVLLGLGTGNIERAAFLKLSPCGFGRYFPYGGYGEDALDRAQMLKIGVQRGCFLAGISPSSAEVYIIGDTHKDILNAKKNGYHSAVITSGFGDIMKINQAGAELSMPDYSDISAWHNWLGL